MKNRKFSIDPAFSFYQLFYGLAILSGSSSLPFVTKIPGRVGEGFHDYLGGLPHSTSPSLTWVHGVSLGESLVACALMEALRRSNPKHALGFTTTHPGVLETIRRKKLADVSAFFPLDFLPLMNRAIRRWHPGAAILVETDFWPAFSFLCRRNGIPLLLVNGRISEKIARFYGFFPELSKMLFAGFSFLGVQTRTDGERLISIGADPEKIHVMGNIKIDLLPNPACEASPAIKAWLGDSRLIVFGSLHPVEFEALRPILPRLAGALKAKILIAPRNIALSPAWLKELQAFGVACALRSALDKDATSFEIVILDTFGELSNLYGLSKVAFVGGSLGTTVGGHNPLEPINNGVPVVMGDDVRNFAELVGDLLKGDAISICSTPEKAEEEITRLFLNREDREKSVSAAGEIIGRHRGALSRTLSAISRYVA